MPTPTDLSLSEGQPVDAGCGLCLPEEIIQKLGSLRVLRRGCGLSSFVLSSFLFSRSGRVGRLRGVGRSSCGGNTVCVKQIFS